MRTLATILRADRRDDAECTARTAIAMRLAPESIDLEPPRLADMLDAIDQLRHVEPLVALGAARTTMQRTLQPTARTTRRLIVGRPPRIVRRTLLAARARLHRRDTMLDVAVRQRRDVDDLHLAQTIEHADRLVFPTRRQRHVSIDARRRRRRLVGVLLSFLLYVFASVRYAIIQTTNEIACANLPCWNWSHSAQRSNIATTLTMKNRMIDCKKINRNEPLPTTTTKKQS